MRIALLLLLVLGLLAATACKARPPTDAPDTVVKELLRRLAKVHGEPGAARSALELLSEASRAELAERAARASVVAGGTVAPEDMLAPSYFLTEYPATRFVAEEDGDRARVAILGATPTERRVVDCVREEGAWRVDLAFPPLAPIRKRADDE